MNAPVRGLDAERAVLGAVLNDPAAWALVSDQLRTGDFADARHRAAWAAMGRLALSDRGIDLVTLKDELLRSMDLDAAGGPAYLAGLLDGMPRVGDAALQSWASIIREAAELRRIVATIDRLKLLADVGDKSAAELRDFAQSAFLSEAAPSPGDSFDSAALCRVATKELERLASAEAGLIGVPTGLTALDSMTGGLLPGQLVLVGARPSRGKSALCLQVAAAATAAGYVTQLVSLEMSPGEVGVRNACSEAGISATWVRGSGPKSAHWPRLGAALSRLAARPFHLEHMTIPTVPQIHARAKRVQAQHGLSLVIVDYLQLCKGAARAGMNRDQELGEVSRGLKAMARRLGVPVLVAAQLNRRVEDRAEGRPRLADFRECGSIEADADIALLLWWKDETGNDAEILVEKHRNGPTGSVRVRFNRDLARFEEVVR